MKKIIGVFGLSGTGKSTFANRLSQKGCKIIDADIIAREVLMKGSPLLSLVKETFGEDILLPDGSLDRKKLGEIVFSDKAELEKLNRITWHEINRIIIKRATEEKEGLILIDCAMLHMVSAKDICDELVFIKSDINTLADRLVQREGIEKSLAEKRIRLQLEDMIKNATTVIENTGTVEDLYIKADKFYEEMKG